MNGIRLHSTTPRRLDPCVRRLLGAMGLEPEKAVWLELHRVKDFRPLLAECHINVLVQRKYHKGDLVSGWTIWQDKANDFVEAQFHTVWRDTHGNLKDLTPRQDRERTVLFIPDPSRHFGLTHIKSAPAVQVYDSVRMQGGVLLNGPTERVHLCIPNLIYEHGIATRSPSAA